MTTQDRQTPPGWRVVEPGERIEASDVEAAPLTFGSLFAGIGGMDLGLERAGMECRWQVEIDPYATRVLARHWPDVRRHDDVRTFPPDDGTDWQVDLIAGGFPCQDISYAGKGAGLSGERSGLWFEFARVVRTLRPRFLIVENVPALLTRGLDVVLGTLATLGYDAEWTIVSACSVGATHMRQRLFIVAYPNGFDGWARLWDSHARRDRSLQAIDGFASARARAKARLANPSELYRGADDVPCAMERNRGLGNAVVPQVAEWIGRRMIASLPARRLLPVPDWCVGMPAESVGNRVYRRDGETLPTDHPARGDEV